MMKLLLSLVYKFFKIKILYNECKGKRFLKDIIDFKYKRGKVYIKI